MVLIWIHKPESSRVDAIAYDKDAETIYVRFKNGSEYAYEECDENTWHQFRDAHSLGAFINEELNSHPYHPA